MLYSALIGNPVKQSVSPLLFRLFGESTATEYAHLKITLSGPEKIAPALAALEALGFVGLNVTLPYKQAVMPLLHELDPQAREIGAVNTVVLREGKRIGYNTDCFGAVRSIATHLRPMTSSDRVVVLGSGGAARALVHGAYRFTKHVAIVGRADDELKRLGGELVALGRSPECLAWNETAILGALKSATFLLNATPVGMVPAFEADPVGERVWDELARSRRLADLCVFDAIYNPYLTMLTRRAAERGASVCSGLWMVIYQAVEAFALWTGSKIDDETCRLAHDALKAKVMKLP